MDGWMDGWMGRERKRDVMDLQELPYQHQYLNLLRKMSFFLHIGEDSCMGTVLRHDCLPTRQTIWQTQYIQYVKSM